jgi:hypothetical protein
MTPRVFRREWVRFGIAAIWLVPAAFFTYFAVDPSVPGGQRVVYAAIALVSAALAARTARIGVVTAPDGVTVRGVVRSWRLRWEEIERFEWGRWRGWGSFPCGVVRRADGSQVTVFALNPPWEIPPGRSRAVPNALAELNEQLATARGWPEPPSSGAPPPAPA